VDPRYDGPWVFFSRDARNRSRADGRVQAGVYRIQSLSAALGKAETRAGVEHLPYRGAHGMRRMLAMHYIGDTDMKTMKRYLKRRDDRLRAVADMWTTG
jgi:integrase